MTAEAQQYSEAYSTEAIYDLAQGEKETFTVYEQNGEIAYITIEKLDSLTRVSDGDYQVSYSSTGAWKAGFLYTISNFSISTGVKAIGSNGKLVLNLPFRVQFLN